MAGAFQTVHWDSRHLEYNVVIDVPAAQSLARHWPTDIVWSGYEIGVAAAFPHQSIEQDLNYVPHHPLKEGYILYQPPPHDRPTWDPTAVLFAVNPTRGYFVLSPPGSVTVEDNGDVVSSQFTRPWPRSLSCINTGIDPAGAEAIVLLSCEPPSRFKVKPAQNIDH